MMISLKKNKFQIGKKTLSVIMALSLALMMLPSTLFKTQASAAEPQDQNDVIVKTDSDMTNFGQFAFNPNSNAANISTYTQNDLLHAIGCKAETESSLLEQASSEIKALLIENKLSLNDNDLTAPKEGYKLTTTSIKSIESKLNSLKATYDNDKKIAKFITSAPSNNQENGEIVINADYAKLIADYDVVFADSKISITQPKEIIVKTKICDGKIIITPSASKNADGSLIYKLTADISIKNLNTLTNKINVSVLLNEDNNYIDNMTVLKDEGNWYDVDLSNYITSSQPMMSPEDESKNLANIINSSNVCVAGDETANRPDLWLGVVPDYRDKLLQNTSYTLQWDNEQTVTIITESTPEKETEDITKYFAWYRDDKRTEKWAPTESSDYIDPNFTKKQFKVNAPESMTSDEISNILYFYDCTGKGQELCKTKLDYNDTFCGNIEVRNSENPSEDANTSYTIQDKTDASFDKFEDCIERWVTFPSDNKPAKTKDGALYVKLNNENNEGQNIIKKWDYKFKFEESNGYLGYEVHNESDGVIEKILDFFFHSGNVKIRFNFDSSIAEKYKCKYTKMDLDNFEVKGDDGFENKSVTLNDLKKDGPDSDVCYFEYSVPDATYISDDEELSTIVKFTNDSTVTPKHNEHIHTTKKVITSNNTDESIVANAPAPKSVAVDWKTKDGEQINEPSAVGTQDLIATVKLTMPDGEGHIFDYTRRAFTEGLKDSEKEVLATLEDKSNPDSNANSKKIYYYDEFNQDSNNDNVWLAPIPIHCDNGTEHTFTLKINKVHDLLGRPAKSGQTEDYSCTFSIDKRDPELTVSWYPVQPVGTYGNYYNQPVRTATICVNEMNFDPDKINIYQEYKDENWNSTGEKRLDKLTWDNKNGYDHTATVICDKNGDYNIKIEGKDKIGHLLHVKGEQKTDPAYTDSFTIDTVAPTVSISFDNNAVVNGKYYTGTRTAIISVNERNWAEPEMITNPIITAGNDGTMGSVNQSGWEQSSTNVYTKTVSFATEGTYALTLHGADKATNNMQTQSVNEFIIDWTKPAIQISGIENRQAYGDVAQPTVTINDANMSSSTTCNVESLGATAGHPYSASPAASDAQYVYSYGNPEKVAENDGVYRISVNAQDMAGNMDVQEMVWSVNRFGSTYVINADTETMMNGYVNNDNLKDVVITEINPSGTESHSVEMTKGSFTETLNEGSDYTANATGGDGSWFECTYTIPKAFFKEDGKYTLNYYSKDKAGNESENTMENRNKDRNSAVNVQFMLDNAKPSVSYKNLSEPQYAETNHSVTAKFEDNSDKFSEAKVIINGEEKYVSGEELDKNNKEINFDLKESPAPYKIETVAIDKAGNEMDRDVKDVVVTSNPFLLWFYNTPLFVGSLVGAAAIIAGVLFLLFKRGIIFKK